ncbi:phosphoprotein associated with glycosphingolipid-enriched microdomains 1 isoform X1 [Alosa sapidissima]|uniref:phosphoprotein associated with glycosphingolipid-enriched microdomains 1 isoform X1 n=3 Tax=Alosa sapidissima TaxID=34773 RepID=UPI001C08E291|nr:phosphoprotein associated with glycosphingolipid-enriched microdomains 1 isoform X1 [Alosa sapidissima]XP_041931583.1 phosphoprotein associated with glycosphingolipid-enriched microdomains 1 isoform X1 [Alosa sapidissima]XP_041931584.1 phosphoprotein associated with glycosphingolipid-enriched microdomains 1 isoform X1 [Alosa sapidissima]
MAPALSVVFGAELAGSGVAVLANGQLALVGILTAITAFLLLSLLMLCASCQGQKKANGQPGDHETLMNGVSEKEVCSQSVESQGTDLAASSSHNGPLTSGTVLTDTMDTSPHPSEEMLSSQSELRSSKCPQDRELPSIPPAVQNGRLTSDPQAAASGDGTYEVVREGGAASRDVSAEDSLYETVKELKDLGLPNGTVATETPPPFPQSPGAAPCGLLNGHLPPTPSSSPPTPDRGPLVAGVEYASVDLNKKSRYSADMEARRRSASTVTSDPCCPAEDEDKPPPIPDKMLDENDNQHTLSDASMLHNGQLPSPGSAVSECVNHVSSDSELSQLYSAVMKTDSLVSEDKEGDYSSIGDLRDLPDLATNESVCNDLYATVKDVYSTSADAVATAEDAEAADPGYETIRIPKSSEDDRSQSDAGAPVEPDYESVGELGLSRDTS